MSDQPKAPKGPNTSKTTYTVTDLYEAATFAVYGEHTSGKSGFGRTDDKQAIAKALAERLGLSLEPKFPDHIRWDPNVGVFWRGRQGNAEIVLDLSVWVRTQRDYPERWEEFDRLLTELARRYNAVTEALNIVADPTQTGGWQGRYQLVIRTLREGYK